MLKHLQAQVKQAFAPQGEIIPLLIKNIGGSYPNRSHKTVHASDITKDDWCPRLYGLMDKLELTAPPRYLPAALKATFDIGEATATLVRESWLGKAAIGNWECTRCNHIETMCEKPATGSSCGKHGHIWRYLEPHFVDPTIAVSGSIDVLVHLKSPKYFITELKIMKGEDFDKLAAPLAEHRIRTSLYMRLVENSPSPAAKMIHTEHAKILYVSRAFGKKSAEHGAIVPFKEFDIHRNDAWVEPYLTKPLALKKFREGTGPMPVRVCASPTCAQASNCPVRKECFSGSYK